MDAVSFLMQYHKCEVLILNKQLEVERWRDIAGSIGGFQMSERVQSSAAQDKTADAIARFADYEAEIARLRAIQNDILQVIESLEADEYNILHKVYILNYNLAEIALQNDRSYSWAYKMHTSALNSVQKILNNRTKVLKSEEK